VEIGVRMLCYMVICTANLTGGWLVRGALSVTGR